MNTTGGQELQQLIEMLNSLQENIGLPSTAPILTDCLNNMLAAQSKEELQAFLNCFLETIQSTKLNEVLEIDTCIQIFRKSADDLFYLTDLEKTVQNSQQNKLIKSLLVKAENAQKKFNEDASKITDEFNRVLEKNKKALQELDLEHLEEILFLQELDLKFRAGIKRIENQKKRMARSLELIKQIPLIETTAERENLRAQYAVELHHLHLLDRRTTYNHFANQALVCARTLASARLSHLDHDDPRLLTMSCTRNCPFEKEIWRWVSGNSLMMPIITNKRRSKEVYQLSEEEVKTETFHADPHSEQFSVQPAMSFTEHLVKAPEKNQSNIVKKSLTFVLSILGLAFAGLMCLTIIGIPIGAALGYVSISALKSLMEKSDFITDRANKSERYYRVNNKIKSIKQQIQKFHQDFKNPLLSKTNGKLPRKKPLLESEAKIEMLLIGHKTTDILTAEEIDEIKKSYQVKISDKESFSPKDEQKKSKDTVTLTVTPDPQPVEDDHETEGRKNKL